MKRLSLTIILACVAILMRAQGEAVAVEFQGEKPTITDFAKAYIEAVKKFSEEEEEEGETNESLNALTVAWEQREKGQLDEHNTFTIDESNGFMVYENRIENVVLKIEMCFWNEADRKHRLFAVNVACYRDEEYIGGQFDGIEFYRYNNATRYMEPCQDEEIGLEAVYDALGGYQLSYALPRSGKDITVSAWVWANDHFKLHSQKAMKWQGRRFSF